MSESPDVVTPEQAEGLRIARQLIEGGVAVFAAPPCPAANGGRCDRKNHNGKEEYDLPSRWQLTVPSLVWLERWKPGWALGAVGGRVADFLDEDPRSGGDESVEELMKAGQMPQVFGIQETPSGGRHYLISALGEPEANGFMPGLDYQGGTPEGGSRAFVWIAPTVKRSKAADTLGQRLPYTWAQEPDMDYLNDFGSDDSGEGIVARLRAVKDRKAERLEDYRKERPFTERQAEQFCQPLLDILEKSPIGKIEEAANNVAVQLSHFVPEVWSADFAFKVLELSLAHTDYDPDHPASGWDAEKFRDVIAGVDGRAPDDWRATLVPESQAEAKADPDAVDALLAEMLTPAQLKERKPPRPLIKGLLNFDSESWIIGAPGSRKSFVVLDMCAHIVRGMDWRGFKVTQGGVVMIVAEGGSGTTLRIDAWEKTHGELGDAMRILPRPVQAKDFKAWAVLVEACRRLKPACIVIDTQARVTVGLKENDATEMGFYHEAVRMLREATGACVLTIHHTGRNNLDARGSNSIDGAQHTELKVIKDDKRPLQGELRSEKQKEMEELPPVPLSFNLVELGVDEDGDPITSLVLAGGGAFTDSMGDDTWEYEEERAPLPDVPEDWVGQLVTNPRANLQRRILQVMKTVGGEVGRSEAQYLQVVKEKWYPTAALKLAKKDWSAAWTSVLAMDQVIGSGGKIRLDPEVFFRV